MNKFVKNYLLANPNTLVSYVRDELGYIKGVVVAVGKNKIGWSLVNGSMDSEWEFRRAHQFPAYHKLQNSLKKIAEAANLVEDDAIRDELFNYVAASTDYSKGLGKIYTEARVPFFDKNKGLQVAINRGLESPAVFSVDEEGTEMVSGTPNDDDLNMAIWKMKERSKKYYKE